MTVILEELVSISDVCFEQPETHEKFVTVSVQAMDRCPKEKEIFITAVYPGLSNMRNRACLYFFVKSEKEIIDRIDIYEVMNS